MTIPSDDEIDLFRVKLKNDGIDVTKKKLRQIVYGAKDNWRCQEAESYVKECEVAAEAKIKDESLEQARKANVLLEHANKIARWALWISIIALVIAMLVAIFK